MMIKGFVEGVALCMVGGGLPFVLNQPFYHWALIKSYRVQREAAMKNIAVQIEEFERTRQRR